MHALRLVLAGAAAITLPFAVGSTAADAAPITFSAAGANPAGIQAQVDAFRADLGTLNPNVVGSLGSGRREINWDGTPDAFSAPNNLPPDFFNTTTPRGVVFATAGTGVQVSANAASGTPVRFGNINPTYTNQFQTFSPERLFTPLGNNVVDVNFFVPGTTTPALTNGFGAVFTDVDLANTTSLQFFDASNASLGTFFVPAGTTPDASLSFLGVDIGSKTVSRVRITNGNGPLGPAEAESLDLVVMDDFLYGEPVAAAANVPETGTVALLAAGILGLGLARSRRRNLSA
jgi:hypothetical protein